ncbi:hypothetical protein NQ318_007648 [Aromia moschata]|uniref:DNA repair and recombination protein RAD54-like n=1 Tax=Aromia moschata TaxID=1265417 RepID=A0AAV8XPJ3_9CUCU|nr:hypothetical protein NQ318_007648 [Aromia moschata]
MDIKELPFTSREIELTEEPELEDLKELRISQGINVWSTNQNLLEKQALHEIEVFAEENDNLEDVNKPDIKNDGRTILNIESYLKSQVDDRSKELANTISKKTHKHHKSKKLKHKHDWNSNESHNIEQVCTVAQNLVDNENIDNLAAEEDCDKDWSGSEYIPSEGELDSDYDAQGSNKPEKVYTAKRKRKEDKSDHIIEKVKDDGLLQNYKYRLDLYYKELEKELSSNQNETEEYHLLKGGLKIPIKLWNNLYSYQQDGVTWLWTLHQKSTGGLLGDEMGLGKTVQIIVFLQSLEYSRIVSSHGRFNGLGPSLIVCPTTVIHQWVKHFHEWAPEFRVAVLHQSGSYQGNKAELIKDIHKNKGIIITTYLGILKYKGNLLEYTWHYVILDEGHKIRNPTAKVSIAVKEFRTPYRIMLTGSPMQNNLTELWSLFDFTNPGMLGNLTTFQEHFATPFCMEATALSVATALKNIITPFLLRRSKNEVQHNICLPNKSEQVLFCSLTDEQRDLYKGYLMSEHVNMILGRGTKNWFSESYTRGNVLVAITTLRKICNHPDIYLCEADENHKNGEDALPEEKFGYYKRSGKMVVVSALLKIWKKQGHRVLLFTQGRAMIIIFQEFLEQQGYKYLKMDGSTSVSSRQTLIDKFNQDSSYDVFLLTTRVGGLGVNLTGANRVIIFDPDWNPATDTQARERAWRIGQDKQVTIYRLLSAGTIEEKMYQRQVWKQLLSNKVLLDPRTNKFFRTSDLHDLFSLQETTDSHPETANIFHESRVRIQESIKRKERAKNKKRKNIPATATESTSSEVQFSEDKIQAMKNLAQQIAKSLSQNKEEKPAPKKTSYQLELEVERQLKLKEKQELKKMTAQELLLYNKEKANQKEDDTSNIIDDCETNASFSKALEYSETTAKLHHILNSGKVKDPDEVKKKAVDIRKTIANVKTDMPVIRSGVDSSENNSNDSVRRFNSDVSSRKKKHKRKDKCRPIVDKSGIIDGERVDGLVKSEVKKIKRDKKKKEHDNESQDDFVLGKLFAKKGVSGALQHDSIIRSGTPRE